MSKRLHYISMSDNIPEATFCRLARVTMVEYKLNRKSIRVKGDKARIAYGIKVCKNSSHIKTIEDISDDKNAVEKLIRDFNDYELDIAHLEQAVEDFLCTLGTD